MLNNNLEERVIRSRRNLRESSEELEQSMNTQLSSKTASAMERLRETSKEDNSDDLF